MTTPKFEHSEIEEMAMALATTKFNSVDHCTHIMGLRGKFDQFRAQIMAQLLGEVKELREMIDQQHFAHEKIVESANKNNGFLEEQIKILKEAMEKIDSWYFDPDEKDNEGRSYACIYCEVNVIPGVYDHQEDCAYRIAHDALAKLNQVKGEG